MNRRGFLGSILALGMAPAVVKAGVLMPVRPLVVLPTIDELLSVAIAHPPSMSDYNAEMRRQAKVALALWLGDRWDELTLDCLRGLDAPPPQLNRIVVAR